MDIYSQHGSENEINCAATISNTLMLLVNSEGILRLPCKSNVNKLALLWGYNDHTLVMLLSFKLSHYSVSQIRREISSLETHWIVYQWYSFKSPIVLGDFDRYYVIGSDNVRNYSML